MLFNFSTKMHYFVKNSNFDYDWVKDVALESWIVLKYCIPLNTQNMHRCHVNSEKKCSKTVEIGINSQCDRSAGRIIFNEIVSMPKKDD